MKKRRLLAITMLVVALTSVAKDYNIVIRHKDKSKNKTEIYVGNLPLSDTINVVPGANVTEIHLSMKKLNGEVILSKVIAITTPETYQIITPPMPEGFLLEIKDNNGVIYTSIEEEE